MKRFRPISFLTAILAVGVVTGASPAPAETAAAAPPESEALAAWSRVYEVFSHPRCANCHVPEDHIPRWSGPSYEGVADASMYHGMNVHGGESRVGAETLPCSTCHTSENSEILHGPPGNPAWALAPVEMVWWARSSSEICEQIKDPARNGGRSLEEVAAHVAEDDLVLWGWTPGPGRAPAPYSAEETAEALRRWASAGAPCPDGS